MISVRDLTKNYANKAVLKGVSTTFPAQQLSSVIGPNGAGKTTLLMLMARLLNADHGNVLLQGSDVSAMPINEFAKRVATLRQNPAFNLRLTVEELVAFGRFPYSRGAITTTDRQLIQQAIDFLSLQSLRHAYLDELSGGQRQMAFLAMTIAQQTDCLLLDEPLNNLDIKHAVQIMRALRRLCDEFGRTVILVVHDINFAANYSDHIVAMKNGAVHNTGSVQQVLTAPQLGALYDMDFDITENNRGYFCNYFNPLGELK